MTIPSESALLKSKDFSVQEIFFVKNVEKLSEVKMTIEILGNHLTSYKLQNISIEKFNKLFEVIG